MKVNLFASISNLPSIVDEMQLGNFTLSSDKAKLKSLITENKLEKEIGSIEFDKFNQGAFFYCETEFKTNSQTDITDNEIGILKDNMTIYHGILDSFVSFFWFRKDNCCSLNSLYVHIPNAKKLIVRKATPNYSTNKGEENFSVSFNNEDILAIGSMLIGSSNLFYHNNIRQATPDDMSQDMIIERQINPYDFKKQTRIERAYQFLLLARRTNQLPLKISFYICIYETLFYGTTNGEISHQIAERVALYISNSRITRNSIYYQIKEAYKIRSTYFHGNSFNGFKKDLNEISFRLDNLTRQVLYKIFSKDSDVFLQNDELLEKSYIDMLFEDYRRPDGMTFESGLKHKRFRN